MRLFEHSFEPEASWDCGWGNEQAWELGVDGRPRQRPQDAPAPVPDAPTSLKHCWVTDRYGRLPADWCSGGGRSRATRGASFVPSTRMGAGSWSRSGCRQRSWILPDTKAVPARGGGRLPRAETPGYFGERASRSVWRALCQSLLQV
jgi:hypothetical protein